MQASKLRHYFIKLTIIGVVVHFFACKSKRQPIENPQQLITTELLKQHVYNIASADMQGRATGTIGQQKAAGYLQNQFKKIGLSTPDSLPHYAQPYPLYKDSLEKIVLSIGTTVAVSGKDVMVSLRNTKSADVQSSGLVFAGYGIDDKNYSDFDSLNVRGKIVVFTLGEPKHKGKFIVTNSDTASLWTGNGLDKKLALLAGKGAKAALILNSGQPVFASEFIKENNLSDPFYGAGSEKKLPFVMLSRSFAEKTLPWNVAEIFRRANLQQPFDKAMLKESNVAITLSIKKSTNHIEAANICGFVEGADKKDEAIIVMAHYDHLGTKNGRIFIGADDNASGVAALLSLANAFANGHQPRRTILFVCVSGEENGLWGSNYYANHPICPLKNTSAVINMDMLGRVDGEKVTADSSNYVYVVGKNKISSSWKKIISAAEAKLGIKADDKYDSPLDKTRIYYRSDHYSLAKVGVPALFFYDGMQHGDYHQPTDTPDKINFSLFAKRVKFVYEIILRLSEMKEILPRDLDG